MVEWEDGFILIINNNRKINVNNDNNQFWVIMKLVIEIDY